MSVLSEMDMLPKKTSTNTNVLPHADILSILS